jgi:hypothetical protein
MNNHSFIFSNGNKAEVKDLCAFMYKINFIIGRKDTENKIVRKYFEEQRYLMNEFSDYGFNWEIHPAYRWALQPDNIEDIIDNVPITEIE